MVLTTQQQGEHKHVYVPIGGLQPFNKLLTVKEAASRLRLTESTIRAWVLQKRIPYTKIGRRVMFRASDVEAVIDNNMVMPKGGMIQ